MPTYVDVHTKIWNDPKFRSYSRDGKLIFLHAWANDSANLCCIYEFDKETAMFQLGFKETEKDDFEKQFLAVLEKRALEYDPETHLIWVVNRFKYRPKSPAVIAGTITELNFLNNHPFVERFIKKYTGYLIPYADRLQTVYRPSLDKQTNKQTTTVDNNYLLTYLSTENIKNLKSIFKDDVSVKRHLLHLNFAEADIDEALGRK